jgi:FkbM family methyltransferase
VIRSLLERALGPLRFQRRLPSEFGSVPIVVSPSAGLKFAFRGSSNIDPTLLSLVRRLVRPGDVVWDIGANVGMFSFPAAFFAGSSGRVFAFEPDTWLVALLRKSCRRQPEACAPVTIVPVALAATEGLRHFSISRRSRAASHLAEHGTTQAGGTAESQTVVTVSADWLLGHLPPPTVVKIDVEGAETEVLSGAKRIIEKVRPRFLVEVGSAHAVEVANLFQGQDYTLYDGERDGTLSTPVTEANWATVAIPK